MASRARRTTPRSSRRAGCDVRALLATLFLSRGTPMLTAGDELGRSQNGNNNAYAQDNEMSFIDWGNGRSRSSSDFVGRLVGLARSFGDLAARRLLHRNVGRRPASPRMSSGSRPPAEPMRDEDWANADLFAMSAAQTRPDGPAERLCVVFNRSAEPRAFRLPDGGGQAGPAFSTAPRAAPARAMRSLRPRSWSSRDRSRGSRRISDDAARGDETFAEIGLAIRSLLNAPT